jgi:hypothetical protein
VNDKYRGSYALTDNVMVLTIPLTALGSPSRMRLHAVTQLADLESGDVLASDAAPKGVMGGSPEGWMTLGP